MARKTKNGGWSTDKTPGVTGIALTGLLKSGQATPQDPVGQKALKYIESLVNPEKKHIAGKDPKVQLQNYVTSINVMALVEAKQDDKYKAIIGDAVNVPQEAAMGRRRRQGPRQTTSSAAPATTANRAPTCPTRRSSSTP